MKARRAWQDGNSTPMDAADFKPSEEDRTWEEGEYAWFASELDRASLEDEYFAPSEEEEEEKKEKWYNTTKFVWISVTIWVGIILFFMSGGPDQFRYDDSETRSDISIQESRIDDLKREVEWLENKVFDLEELHSSKIRNLECELWRC